MRFNHLNIPTHWQSYYTKYPEGYTILEALINWVGQVDSMVDNVNSWNEYLDQFVKDFDGKLSETLEQTLTEWQESGFLNIIINEALQTEVDLKAVKYFIDVKKDYGAKGDGVTDDTQAIKNAVAKAESLITDRFLTGVTILFPMGTYKLTSTINIKQSGIAIEGESLSATIIYAPNANFDLFHFDGTLLALYNVSMENLRIATPGNATAGRHLKVSNVINGQFSHMNFSAWYDGLAINGGGKIIFDNIIFSQENRTAGTHSRYAIDIEYGTDCHFSNIQVNKVIASEAAYSISIRKADGLYFSNSHFHAGTIVQPTTDATMASVFFDNCYFDKAADANFMFLGTATTAFRNFMFSNCYFRDAQNGVVFNTSTEVNRILFTGCHFSQIKNNGVECKNGNVKDVTFSGCEFTDNNTTNQPTYADMNLLGTNFLVVGCLFQGGGPLGSAVVFKSGMLRSMLAAASFAESTAGTKFANNGSACRVGSVIGQTLKNRGSATIPTGQTTITVTHGVDLPITGENIILTPRTNPGSQYWITNVTATQFTINLAAAPAANAIFTWVVDITH